MSEWIDVLQNFGFPVFVTLWFMFRMEPIIKANTEVTLELKEYIRNRL